MSLNFTDIQVLTLVRAYPGLNIYELTLKANEEMGMKGECHWSNGKVHKAIERLKKSKRVQTRFIVKGGRSCQLVYATV